MAAVGRAVRAQIGQLCAARQCIRVAGFRTTTPAVLDRNQSAVMPNVGPAAMAWEEFGVTYPVWCRDTLSGIVFCASLVHTKGTSHSVM